ncbi:MDR family MFS transporter [Brevibacillus sp. GCM10020057]|uniref:MDR family MFS transporter n=1 Tax=Brevibacillus sp. GCM10020057 TaxID=3317327 RepID=UPI003624E857
MYEKLDGSILLPFFVVGLQPLAGIAMSLAGGGLADRFGRKPVMIISLLVQTVSMTGFIFADSIWEFALLSFLNGFGVPLFVPAANAQITDIVPPSKRDEIFALLHTAFNVGPAIGPLIGLAVFHWNQAVVFASAAIAFGLYALVVWWKVPETLPKEARKELSVAEKLPFVENQHLYLFTLLAVPVGLLYAQVETTFPLHLKSNFGNHMTILSTMLTVNAVMVITLMVWISKKTEKHSSVNLIFLAYMFFGLVAIGYGFGSTFWFLILTEAVFSLAEMIGISHLQKFVSLLAPADQRGSYFSIFGMYMQIPRFIGPFASGVVFVNFGGETMYLVLGVLLLAGGFLQLWLMRWILKKKQAMQNTA